jgi:hypothetical protein
MGFLQDLGVDRSFFGRCVRVSTVDLEDAAAVWQMVVTKKALSVAVLCGWPLG